MTTDSHVRIVHIDTSGPLWADVYRWVLAPAFPPTELLTSAGLAAALDDGAAHALAVVDRDGSPLATAVAEHLPHSDTVLLAYLAVTGGRRGGGIGAPLLREALATWHARYRPRLILAEAEHPAAYEPTEAYGDPTGRLRFYARNGGVAVDVPYFQPTLRPGLRRHYGMVLLTFPTGGAIPAAIPGAALRPFLAEQLIRTEGHVGKDAATVALFASVDRGDVRLLDPRDTEQLPLSTAP
ncbi:N-acetyltransferase [Stackebrandtia soli]|uniref:N-acetyltransferase n=1 Tax=Stackebrandtia soli TaxID=1892856 RepID=UPI0039E7E784